MLFHQILIVLIFVAKNGGKEENKGWDAMSILTGGYNSATLTERCWLKEKSAGNCSIISSQVMAQHTNSKSGLVLSVFNENSGRKIFKKEFPLYKYWAYYADLEWHLQRIRAGRLVILVLPPPSSEGLRNVTAKLQAFGSLLVNHLDSFSHWTWIFYKNGKTILENGNFNENATNYVHFAIEFKNLTYQYSNPRQKYCDTYNIEDDFCTSYFTFNGSSKLDESWVLLRNTPIIINAGNRYYYLYQTLKSLYSAPGFNKQMLFVALGEHSQPTIELLNILHINYRVIDAPYDKNLKLFYYYKEVYALVLNNFPAAAFAIFLDEDVEVSPDFFFYFNQTAPLLRKDPSLYCINAYAANGFMPHARNVSKLFRGEVQVEWGYMLTREFLVELVNTWPSIENVSIIIYDYYIYKEVRLDRECLFPEVSRTKHFGFGLNLDPWAHEEFNMNMPLVQKYGIDLGNVDMLAQSNWTLYIEAKLERAIILNGNPCTKSFLDIENGVYVIYYSEDTFLHGAVTMNLFTLTRCLKYWGFSLQGSHKGVSFLHPLDGIQLYLVAVHYSPYSKFWTPETPLFNFDDLSEEERNDILFYLWKEKQPPFLLVYDPLEITIQDLFA